MKLVMNMVRKPFKAGEVIFDFGEKSDDLFLIHSGSVEIVSREGLVLATLKAGELSGEMASILGARERTARAVTATNAVINVIDSTTMWRKLRATVLPDHSLEWLRVIRPAGFAAEMAARAVGLGGVLRPLARPVDALVRRGGGGPSWTHMPVGLPAGTLASAEVDDGEAAALFVELTGGYEVRPNWRAQSLARMLAESRRKAVYGAMVRRKVVARNGRPVGLFLYYGDLGRVGRVVQVLHAPGQAGIVLDSMLAHAGETGLVALRGRTMPALLEAMLGRRFMFVHASSSIVHARDKSLIEPFVAGRAFFNGFAGESWSRLIGDRFD